jgi:hypothetical protein
MPQYVIQIQTEDNGVGIGWLAKCFEVTQEYPIPSEVPANRVQVIMTNTSNFNEIVEAYNEYTTQLTFSYDSEQETISCAGAYTHTWNIN